VQHPDGSQDNALDVLRLLYQPQMQQLLYEAATSIAQQADWAGLPRQEETLRTLAHELQERRSSLQLQQRDELAVLQEQLRQQQQNLRRGGAFDRGFLDSRISQQRQFHRQQQNLAGKFQQQQQQADDEAAALEQRAVKHVLQLIPEGVLLQLVCMAPVLEEGWWNQAMRGLKLKLSVNPEADKALPLQWKCLLYFLSWHVTLLRTDVIHLPARFDPGLCFISYVQLPLEAILAAYDNWSHAEVSGKAFLTALEAAVVVGCAYNVKLQVRAERRRREVMRSLR
jgi:hypothetical protein